MSLSFDLNLLDHFEEFLDLNHSKQKPLTP